MGIESIEPFGPALYLMPNHIVNAQLAGQCYLILYNPDAPKTSHFLVLIDLSGSSTEDSISGLLVHMAANIGDGFCPHETRLEVQPGCFARQKVKTIHIGNLRDSHYLNNPAAIIPYVVQHDTPDIYQRIVNLNIRGGVRSALISLLANNVYYEMVEENHEQERWTSTLNCQRYARAFIIDGLGLLWPDVDMASNHLPIIVDIGTICLSTTQNTKVLLRDGT